MERRGRKNVSLCAAIPTLPGSPGSAVPGMWPAARLRSPSSTPSTTITETPMRGIIETADNTAAFRGGHRGRGNGKPALSLPLSGEAPWRNSALPWLHKTSHPGTPPGSIPKPGAPITVNTCCASRILRLAGPDAKDDFHRSFSWAARGRALALRRGNVASSGPHQEFFDRAVPWPSRWIVR